MALGVRGAQDDGNGLVTLQVREDGSVAAAVSRDGVGVDPAPSTDPAVPSLSMSETVSSNTALDPDKPISLISGSRNVSLPAGSYNGQEKTVRQLGAGTSVIAADPEGHINNGSQELTSVTLAEDGDYVVMKYRENETHWYVAHASLVGIGGGVTFQDFN